MPKKIRTGNEEIVLKENPWKVVNIREKNNKLTKVFFSASDKTPEITLEFEDYSTQSRFTRKLYLNETIEIQLEENNSGKIRLIRTSSFNIF